MDSRLTEATSSLLSPEIRISVHPDDQRVPAGDDEPLPDVELGVVDEEGPLDVLLNHVPRVVAAVAGHRVQDVLQPHLHRDTWEVQMPVLSVNLNLAYIAYVLRARPLDFGFYL